MFLGRVIGTVWSTKKDENLVGAKFLIVLVATGSSSRQTSITKDKPVDAVIMAIVDKLDISLKEYLEEHKKM